MGQAASEELQQAIKEAKETKTLNLQNKNLQKIPSLKLDPQGITGLDLSYNQLEDFPAAACKFPNLTFLSLANNKIARFQIPAAMPKLEKVDLAFNPLVELPTDLHEKTPSLLALTIYDCAVTRLPVETFTALKHLTAVVNGNYLQIGPEHLPTEITARLPGFNDQHVATEILDKFLYLGSVRSAQNWSEFERLKITHVVCMTSMHQLPFEGKVVYKKVKIEDYETENIQQHFEEVNQFIDACKQSNGAVLVHCAAGVSRSASAVIAYVMSRHKKGATEATDFVAQRRPCICPNNGFQNQLVMYEKELTAATATADE